MEKEKLDVNNVVEEKVEAPEEKPDTEKSVEELKAEAESAESLYKEKRGSMSDEEIRQNMIRRRDKAIEKAARLAHAETKKSDELETRDLITLAKADIAEDSEEAKILVKYKAGGIIKSFAEGLNHAGIKAEFEALKAKNTAKSVIDESDSDDVRLKTKKEVVAGYRASGEVPTDPKAQQAIVEANLEEMGI